MVGVQLVVGAALVDRLDRPTRLLAARRTRPPALAGRWELPGGKVEPGETPQDALHRELAEELDVTVRLGAELLPTTGATWPLTAGLEMRVWWCELVAGQVAGSAVHDELRWLPATQLDDVAWLEPDRPLVALVGRLLQAG